ncbi:DNA mismatch repair protein-MLH2/PMS1/Pms2 family [Ceraceosorus bombacis]|uniref:DNA mismatch repair protein PMS1 n=1 Tax=Ceraceosorus bombacis TaxID=401625 RepID=A0A0P1B867_9BASI|nr:DNA mismatch repair protein-MLH2/PMS1/Pms2 family [Ceraceosorus bombacis]
MGGKSRAMNPDADDGEDVDDDAAETESREDVARDLYTSQRLLDASVQKAMEVGFGNGIEREISRIYRQGEHKYKVSDRGAFSGVADDKLGLVNKWVEKGTGRAWRRLRRPSDMHEYAKEMREYRASENPRKATGKVFVFIDGFMPAPELPIPPTHKPTRFHCILDNGLHVVKTGGAMLKPPVGPGAGPTVSKIGQEFELIKHKNLEFSLTLVVERSSPHLAETLPAPPTPSTSDKKPPSLAKGFKGLLSSPFHSPRRGKSTVVAPPASPTREPILSYLARDGTLGRASIVFESVAEQSLGRCHVVEVPVLAGPQGPQRGLLRLKLFYLPAMPSVPRELLPDNLSECIKGMQNAAWHNSPAWMEGVLTQLGGDCTTWRRRPVKAQGAHLIGYNEITKKPTVKIDLSKAVAVEGSWDPHSRPSRARSAASSRPAHHSEPSEVEQTEETSWQTAHEASTSSSALQRDPSAIQAIPRSAVHRITSGQVVLDLQGALKELIENALDAGATNIEVRFKDYGGDSIEVIDNGSGIDPTNYDGVGLKHHTSKLASFDDLTSVSTFGFRGEAISSLCALAKVQFLTATKETAPVGTVLELGADGSLRDKRGKSARQRGTTVIVQDLFASLPVRRREFERNLKREYAKAQSVLQAYALICKGARWSVSNTPKGGRKTPVLSLQSPVGPGYMLSNVSTLFGAKTAQTLMPMNLELRISGSMRSLRRPMAAQTCRVRKRRRVSRAGSDAVNGPCSGSEAADSETDEEDDSQDRQDENSEDDDLSVIRVTGLISKPQIGQGRASTDRQNLYLNGRPWDNACIIRAFNEVYRSFNTNQSPLLAANFEVPGSRYDVNVSPDKRTLLIHDETLVTEQLKTQLETTFAPFRGSFVISNLGPAASKVPTKQSQINFEAPTSSVQDYSRGDTRAEVADCASEESGTTASPMRTSSDMDELLSSPAAEREGPRHHESSPASEMLEDPPTAAGGSEAPEDEEGMTDNLVEDEDAERNRHLDNLDDGASSLTDFDKSLHARSYRDEILSFINAGESLLSLDMDDLESRIRAAAFSGKGEANSARSSTQAQQQEEADQQNSIRGAGVSAQDGAAVERELSRVINKADFKNMQVTGQFNLGFIIARRRTHADELAKAMDDLFIVDQHASDEKYNFETLQRETRIRGQRLISPRVLELSPADELVAVEHIEAIQLNGFELQFDEGALPGTRLRLISQPVSKGTVFGVADLEELIHLLSDTVPGGTASRSVRCSKARAMFASRACRKSVMIGKALNQRQMSSILLHFSEIEQPWNCPHGRPTMRHLADLKHVRVASNGVEGHKRFARRPVDWSRLGKI